MLFASARSIKGNNADGNCFYLFWRFCVLWSLGVHCSWFIFDQCPTYTETRQLVFTSKMLEKRLWKSDILSKDADADDLYLYWKCHSSTGVFFKHFASKSQLPGLSVRGALVKNGKSHCYTKLRFWRFLFQPTHTLLKISNFIHKFRNASLLLKKDTVRIFCVMI